VSANAVEPLKSTNELADERTRLALSRTMVALDRTLLAWVRTATSLISFGFTIYKFFQALRDQQAALPARHLMGPRGLGMVMIAIGVGGLVLATVDYRNQMKQLREEYAAYGPFRRSLAVSVATIICGLGVLGFVLVLLRQ
jgi:putative membrane protein